MIGTESLSCKPRRFLAGLDSVSFPLLGVERAKEESRSASYVEQSPAFEIAIINESGLFPLRAFDPICGRLLFAPVVFRIERGNLAFGHFGKSSERAAACTFDNLESLVPVAKPVAGGVEFARDFRVAQFAAALHPVDLPRCAHEKQRFYSARGALNNINRGTGRSYMTRLVIRINCAVLIIAAIGAFSISAQDSEESKSIAQIRAVLDDQVAAWNRGDLETYMKGYWRSPRLTFYSGDIKVQSWDTTLERYNRRYKSEGRQMGTLTFSDLEIEMLGRESAFVRGRWQVKMSSETPDGLFTLIFRKFPDGWKIVHDHTSGD